MRACSLFSFISGFLLLGWLATDALCGNAPLVLSLERSKYSLATNPNGDRRRATPITQIIDNDQLGDQYYANITIGTPGQILRLSVATNTGDSWVNVANSSLCEESTLPCKSLGTCKEVLLQSFGQADRGLDDPAISSSYRYLSNGFNDSYTTSGSWSGAAGSWALDTFNIGGISIGGVQFGLAYNSTWIDGTLALGYLQSESNGDTANQYNNLPALMLSNGQIECAAYSLWLDKINTPHGQLIFGGVNTAKFLGTLESFPTTLPSVDNFYIIISLSEISISYNGGSFILQDTAFQVSPDAGSPWIWLPPNITDPLFAQFGATYDADQSTTWIPCAAGENTSTIDFTFGATTIAVSMDELVQDYNSSTCFFGIIPSDSGAFLGVTFLRSAYIVFDLSHNFVWLAPTNSKPSSDNIVPIGSAGVETLTGIPTSTPHPTGVSTTPAHHNLSTGAKAGIGVGVGVGVGALLLTLLLVYSIMSRRRRARQHSSYLRPASHTPGQSMRQTSSEVDTHRPSGPLPVVEYMSQLSAAADHGLPRSPLSANSVSSDNTRAGYGDRIPYELDAAPQNMQVDKIE